MQWTRRRLDLLAILGLILASFAFCAEQVSEHDLISPIDEYQYIDYYAKVADKGVVRSGEQAGAFARKYMMCHGVRLIETSPPNPKACRNPRKGTFPLEGGTTADIYSPVYFFLTRAAAQPLVMAGVDFVDAGRYVGGLWLGAAATLLYLAMRRGKVPLLAAFGLSLAMVGSLPAYWSTTYISTDAPALLAGAAALLLALAARDRRPFALWMLPGAAAVATLTKVQNLVGFVAAGCYLLLLVWGSSRDQTSLAHRLGATIRDRRTASAAATLAAGVLAQGAWLSIRSAIAAGPQFSFSEYVTFKPIFLVFEVTNFLPRLAMGAVEPYVTGPWSQPIYLIGTVLAISGVVGLAVARGVPWDERMVGVSTMFTAIVSAPALALAIAVTTHSYITLPWRYGMTLVPWALFSAALLIDSERRWARIAIAGVGLAAWATSLMLGEAP